MSYSPKIGDLLILNDQFIKVIRIDTKDVPVYKKVDINWFKSKKVPTGEFEKEITKVYWRIIGDNTGAVWSDTYLWRYDWERMYTRAKILMNQAKIYLSEK